MLQYDFDFDFDFDFDLDCYDLVRAVVNCGICELETALRSLVGTIRKQSLINKQTPRHESASELYRPSDRRLSAKSMPTFADRRCEVPTYEDREVSRRQRDGSLRQ
jgi:hypothetical protein